MKILAIVRLVDKEKRIVSAVDVWRIQRPIEQLQKHTDWQIDIQHSIVRDFKGLEKDPDRFIDKYGEEEAKHLGQYDIIFASYSSFTSPHIYTIAWAANKKYGTKLIMDVDDDVFDVDPGNFSFWQAAGRAGHEFLKISVQSADYICTTNNRLAIKIEERSDTKPTIKVIPNYISDVYPNQEVDNGEKIIIGFFGGASHYLDLHETYVLEAMQKLMHRYKNVYFKTCGQPVDYYLPKARVLEDPVATGEEWATTRLPGLKLDIAVAPLLETEFNQHKTDIKWQESTRVGSTFVCTNTGAYADLDDDAVIKVGNTIDSWFDALEELVTDVNKRKALVSRSKELLEGHRIEDHYQEYIDMFKAIHE